MINAEILREYDIRGIYKKSLKLEDIQNIAKKISNIISNINTPKIIIGHDGRLSSLEIKNKLIDTFSLPKFFGLRLNSIPSSPFVRAFSILETSFAVQPF